MKRIKPLFGLFAVSVFPSVFMYANNSQEANFKEVVLPIFIFLIVATLILSISYIFTKNVYKSSLIASFSMLLFQNYSLIEVGIKRFTDLKYWHILPICIFVLFNIALYISISNRNEMFVALQNILSITFVVLIIMNIFIAVPNILKKILIEKEQNMTSAEEIGEYKVNSKNDTNVYYLLFDEYSNFDVIENYYNYDNSNFANFLEKTGFTVSYNSINESQQTATIIANYMNLDYVVSDEDVSKKKQLYSKKSRVIDIFRGNEYQINAFGSAGNVFDINLDNHLTIATSISGEDLQALLLKMTPLYPLITTNTYENAKQVNDSFKKVNEKAKNKDSKNFNIFYCISPHQPFVFDKNGKDVNIESINNWEDRQYYLEQYMYITTKITELISEIVLNDPDSIIIIQSDHSARSLQNEKGEYLIDKYDRRHCLNAVYYKGENIDIIKGQSGVNTLRIVLGKLFDLELPILEVPQSEHEFY